MTEKEQIAHFENELRNLIDRFRSEYDISYAAVIGTMHMMMHDLCTDAIEGEES